MHSFYKYPGTCNSHDRPGVVLLITLVLLVVLSTLAFTLSSRVAAQRHSAQYLVDYSKARYSCDSALKYALATLEELDPQLVERPNEPDFSDLFIINEAEYRQMLGRQADENNYNTRDNINDINDSNSSQAGIPDFSPTIRGPYGPSWPFVTEPAEFEIGSATVRIEIEDENAKYPVGWMMLDDEQIQPEAEAGFETFCEWMALDDEQVGSLKKQLDIIYAIKPFKLEFKPIATTIRTPSQTRTRSRRATTRARTARKTISASEQFAAQNTDFAEFLHSSLIDTELLARPTILSETRKESALKYMGMWASRKVNVNTAPRHVLETAFTFGGDAAKIAEEIIQRRRVKPFKNIEDLKRSLFRYSVSITKCEPYITTNSRFFTIRVIATSGVAKASAVAAITKDRKNIKRVAVISG